MIDLYNGFKALSNVDRSIGIGISSSLFFVAGSASFLILYTMTTTALASPIAISSVPYYDYYLPLSLALMLSGIVLLSETFYISDKYFNRTIGKIAYRYLILMIAVYIFATIFDLVFSLGEFFPILILIFLSLLYWRVNANFKEIKYGQKKVYNKLTLVTIILLLYLVLSLPTVHADIYVTYTYDFLNFVPIALSGFPSYLALVLAVIISEFLPLYLLFKNKALWDVY